MRQHRRLVQRAGRSTAWRDRTPALYSPSASPYAHPSYIGVSKVLQQLGIIQPGRVKTAGASAGTLAQAVDMAGMAPHDYWIE